MRRVLRSFLAYHVCLNCLHRVRPDFRERAHYAKSRWRNSRNHCSPKLGPPIDPVYWGNLYYVGIDHFIANPRHIVRLANTLRVTFPAVKGEVNPSDFIAIETLRVFCPLAYDVVRKNADEFTGHSVRVGGPVGKESFRNFHESWMKDIQEEDRATVKNLLAKLFPRFQSAWDNTNYPDEWERRWRKELRVCSQATFPVYFRFGLPEGEVSLSEVRAVLSVASDHDA